MKDCINVNQNMKPGNEGSSLVIALFFFMLCALICAGILYVANSSIFGVSKHFNAEAVPDEYVGPPIPTIDPSITGMPTPDPDYPEESAVINLVFNTLQYDFASGMVAAESGGEYDVYWVKNHGYLTYEILSYIHGYYKNSQAGNYVAVDEYNNVHETFIVTVSDIPVEVVVDFYGTQGSSANGSADSKKGLNFQGVKITVSSAVEGTTCPITKTYEYTVPNGGQFYIRWRGASGGKPKMFLFRSTP